jgi:hypothetical protein
MVSTCAQQQKSMRRSQHLLLFLELFIYLLIDLALFALLLA